METDGCYAVNFNNQSKENCELVSGLSGVPEKLDDVISDLYVTGAYFLLESKRSVKSIDLKSSKCISKHPQTACISS